LILSPFIFIRYQEGDHPWSLTVEYAVIGRSNMPAITPSDMPGTGLQTEKTNDS